MASALTAAARGEEARIAAPEGELTGAVSNLNTFVNHAQSSHTYHSTRAPDAESGVITGLTNFLFKDPMAGALAATDLADMNFGDNMLAEVGIAASATGSWVSVANNSNTTWSSLAKRAESMGIEVKNKEPVNALATLGGASPLPGAQEINETDVFGAGNALAGMAGKVGMTEGPDTTGLQEAMAEYQLTRDKVATSSRGVVSFLFKARSDVNAAKTKAAEHEKADWEAYKAAVTAFASGITLALGGKLEMDMDAPKGTDVASTVSSGVTGAIDMKIKSIDAHINAYKAQEKSWQTVVQQQLDLKLVEEHKIALGEQRRAAKNVEVQEDLMIKKIIQFGEAIDKKWVDAGHGPKGSSEGAESAALLAAIRSCRTHTTAAAEGISAGTAALAVVYSRILEAVSARAQSQEGRSDARFALYDVEKRRWSRAVAAAVSMEGVLLERQAQLSRLETAFLSTFMAMGSKKMSGSLVSTSY